VSPSPSPWLTLTDLGRLFGISAVFCGRLLDRAGLREAGGRPSARALHLGLARQPDATTPHRTRTTLWQRAGCQALLEQEGLVPMAQRTLVEQWAELLWALKQGSPAISTSAEQMAEDLPRDLIEPVNRQLQANGWDFQVHAPHTAAQARPAAQRRSAARPTGHGRPNLRVVS
jgi:hypothetical protein